jgi:polysaccharide export outer membrane protein
MKKYLICVFTLSMLLWPSFMSGQEESGIEDYKIGARDLLEIRVFGHEDMTMTVRVSEDGYITLPLLKKVEVENLTKSDLEAKLTKLYTDKYLENPQVTIFILEYRSKMVSVIGAVVNQGQYELLGRQSLVEIITKAGGITSSAGEEIYVTRPDGGEGQVFEIPIDELLMGDIDKNIDLQPKDIIHVPIERLVKVYVFGKVNKPGALVVKKSKLPTLVQAIAEAGGFAERASKTNVKVLRKGADGRIITLKINVKNLIDGNAKINNIQLQEGDTVYVSQSVF